MASKLAHEAEEQHALGWPAGHPRRVHVRELDAADHRLHGQPRHERAALEGDERLLICGRSWIAVAASGEGRGTRDRSLTADHYQSATTDRLRQRRCNATCELLATARAHAPPSMRTHARKHEDGGFEV